MLMPNNFPKLHNAAWPGVVGKGDGTRAADRPRHDARSDGRGRSRRRQVRRRRSVPVRSARQTSTPPTTSSKQLADKVRRAGLVDRLGRRAGLAADRRRLGDGRRRGPQASSSTQVRKGCRIARKLRELGVRPYGVVRIDSACRPTEWAAATRRPTRKRIADTFREACDDRRGLRRAAGRRRRNLLGRHAQLAAHGAAAGNGRPARRRSAFRPTWPTRCLYVLGYNAPEDAILPAELRLEGHGRSSTRRYKQLTAALRPWTIDFHVAQNDGDGPRLRLARQDRPPLPAQRPERQARHRQSTPATGCATTTGNLTKKFQHICWDGCMFPNETMMEPQTWNDILAAMIAVRDAHGWR